ncbi:GyrI-like domain-containing protein [Tumebacillus flagellatus]|uniref:AraC effector-binding domain-containing protein n=1 Tax=Tumebacillus flagellatus TaxID=1157490 RepID=A0A074LG35_9BACL|nr:GyrI-like domain-containing protein [Tumebacillus flagellatus]KEO81181.1 hypothetical protein EL26_22255 [Tumebacillus flagellatus]
MQPELKTMRQKHLIGMYFSGPFQLLGVEMPKLWEKYMPRIEEIPGVIAPSVQYGVSDENFEHRMYTEFLAVEVEAFTAIPVGMVGFTLPSTEYAVFTHQGPMSTVPATYQAVFGWLAQNGYAQDTSVLRFERYDERYNPTLHEKERAENAYEIWVPIRKG